MNLARGVVFLPEEHEYWYRGERLSGVTGIIGKSLGMRFPETYLEEHRAEGVRVHRAIQRWIETKTSGSLHPGVAWFTDTFTARRKEEDIGVYAEVLVSDFVQYASAVDIVVVHDDLSLDIYDVKKGVFHRDYVSLQLGCYKYFIEKHAGRKVRSCWCVCLRDREYYPVFPEEAEQVERVLYGRKGGGQKILTGGD
jgi:hypothetical protein